MDKSPCGETLEHVEVSMSSACAGLMREGQNDAQCLLCGGGIVLTEIGLFDTRFGIPGDFSFGRCSRCGFEELLPIPSPEELKQLYEKHYNFGGQHGTRYTKMRESFYSSVIYRFWSLLDGDISFHCCKGQGKLLDFGCNEGRGLLIYRKNGFEVEGLELSEKAAAVARSAGFVVHTCDLRDLSPSFTYDVIVLSNVLEHATDPLRMLRELRDHLNPGGQLWISCPNNQSWLRSVFQSYWINWHVPFHITQFSLQSLTTALQKSGFAIRRSKQFTPAMWAISSLIAWGCARKGKPTTALRNPFLILALLFVSKALLFPVFWIGNLSGRGDCLAVTVSKVSS